MLAIKYRLHGLFPATSWPGSTENSFTRSLKPHVLLYSSHALEQPILEYAATTIGVDVSIVVGPRKWSLECFRTPPMLSHMLCGWAVGQMRSLMVSRINSCSCLSQAATVICSISIYLPSKAVESDCSLLEICLPPLEL